MDALGYLVRFRIPAARAHDLQGVPGLPGGLEFGAFVGDRASGADWLLEDLDGSGAEAAVPPKRNRTAPRARDRDVRVAAPCGQFPPEDQGVPGGRDAL